MRTRVLAVYTIALVAASCMNPSAPSAKRKGGLQDAKLVFRPFVFSTKEFPPVDFERPSEAEAAIGPYKLRTTFYDASQRRALTAIEPGRYGAIVEVLPQRGEPTKQFLTLYRTPGPINWRGVRLMAALQLPPGFGIHPQVLDSHAEATAEFLKWEFPGMCARSVRSAIHFAGLHETAPDAPLLARTGPWPRNERWWHELKKKTGDLEPLRYLVHLPPGAEEGGKRWPTILFLHGAGERGDDLKLVEVHGPPKNVKKQKDFPFIVISPQCAKGTWWSAPALEDLMKDVQAKYPIDADRIYLTGLSMGGFGTWSLASEHPDWFAAIAPICGGGDVFDVDRIKDVPTWVFHGAKDGVVSPVEAEDMVEALRKAGGRVRFTVYPEAGHDSWTATYDNPALYAWLLEQRRGKPAEPKAATQGREPSH